MSIQTNLEFITSQLHDQTLIVATKYVGVEEMNELYQYGIKDFGENRVDDFLLKKKELTQKDIHWHFIGQLQTNKVKKSINEIDYLHSLDRISLANEIQKYRVLTLPVFVEVHISREESKSGVMPEELINFVKKLEKYDKIMVVGLMGMAEHSNDSSLIRSQFSLLRSLRDEIIKMNLKYAPCQFLSMGMSSDYLIAIEEGATHVRLGSVIFNKE